MGILILLLPLIVLWFFLIRPQQQRAKERQAMVARLKVGDEVATAGGIIGVVTEVDLDDDPEVLLLEVAQGVEIAVLRRGIAEVRYIEGDDDLGAELATGVDGDAVDADADAELEAELEAERRAERPSADDDSA